MTIQMIPLSKLRPSEDNPRKKFCEDALAGLAQSIKTDGLLQNLVAAKPKGRKRIYHIISGERRYRALSLLVEQGDLPKDVSVPVEVKDDLSSDETLRIAAIENIQREDLTPLEEATAIATLVENGESISEIAAQTGLSVGTIRRRLALLSLSHEVSVALSDGKLTLSQAEALSLGSHDAQNKLLERIETGWDMDGEDIRGNLIGRAPSLSMAIFPKEEYKGTLTTDLFAEDETTYFDDAEQFFALQKQAAEKLVADYEREHDFAELVEGNFPHVAFRKCVDGESGGVIVQLHTCGEVEIHEGLQRRQIDPSFTETPKPKATYGKPMCEYIAMHKSAAVQIELIGNPLIAKKLGVADLLYRSQVYGCFLYLEKTNEGEAYFAALEREATELLTFLGREPKNSGSFRTLMNLAYSQEKAFELVQVLDETGLDRLFAFLSLLRFGQQNTQELDCRESSVFNIVGQQTGTDMNKHWIPSVWFFTRRSMSQLQPVLKDSGLSRLFGNGKGYKKTELVKLMADYFTKVRNMTNPKPDQEQARNWLPEAMSFPAIDPDAVSEDENFPDEEDEHAEAA